MGIGDCFGVGGTIGQGAGGAVGQHDVARFAALAIDGSSGGVGDIHSAESDAIFVEAVDFERAIGGAAAQDVVHMPLGRGDGDMRAVGFHHHAAHRSGDRGGVAVVVDGDGAGEVGVFHIVVEKLVSLIGHRFVGGLGECAVVPLDVHVGQCFVFGYHLVEVGVVLLASCGGQHDGAGAGQRRDDMLDCAFHCSTQNLKLYPSPTMCMSVSVSSSSPFTAW